MGQVFVHQRDGAGFITGFQRLDDGGVFIAGVFGGRMGLVHQGNQRTARNQFAQQLGQYLIAHEFGHADMEIPEQFGAARHVFARHRLLFPGHMIAQRLDPFRRHGAHESARHFSLEHAAHGEHLARLVDGR